MNSVNRQFFTSSSRAVTQQKQIRNFEQVLDKISNVKPFHQHFQIRQYRSVSPDHFLYKQSNSKRTNLTKFSINDTSSYNFAPMTTNWWYDFQENKLDDVILKPFSISETIRIYNKIVHQQKKQAINLNNHLVIRQTDDIVYLNNQLIIQKNEILFGRNYLQSLNNLFFYNRKTDKFLVQKHFMNQIQIIKDMLIILNHSLNIALKMFRFNSEQHLKQQQQMKKHEKSTVNLPNLH